MVSGSREEHSEGVKGLELSIEMVSGSREEHSEGVRVWS
jgi:hypothetical protein